MTTPSTSLPCHPCADELTTQASERAVNWLAGAIAFLPLVQFFPLDFDRSATLLLLPGIWFGRNHPTIAGSETRSLKIFGALLLAAIAISTLLSDQWAPSVVTAASWLVLAAAALVTGEAVKLNPSHANRLLEGLAVGGAAGIATTWLFWVNTGRGPMPLYAHHRLLGLHMIGAALATTALVTRPRATRWPRLGWIGVGVLVWGGMLWSGGRAPLVATAVGLFVWWCKVPRRYRLSLAKWSAVQLGSGLAISALFWSSRPELGWWHALDRTTASIEVGTASALTTSRSDFWRETGARARLQPWWGHGPDSYRFINPKLDGQQPHNFVLQFWLDLGLFGAIPACLLLGLATLRGWRAANPDLAPWLGLLVASLTAGLLDGVFYHLVALIPAATAIGILLVSTHRDTLTTIRTPSRFRRVAVGFAAVILIFHTWLFYHVATAEPPARPQAASAQVLRWFPSTTYGLWRWLDAWKPNNPQASLAWAQWAQQHSSFTPLFHIYAARCLLAQGNRAAAQVEFSAALRTVHYTARPQLLELQKNLGLVP